ncbi:MAG: hypothetical protein IJB27_05265 [Clostridia bacterium]|nr:hypothetical protein [Clostridia bacterium]
MKACTFFGHRDCPNTIKEKLQDVLEELIIHHHVDTFYIGNQGQFDALVYRTLQELKKPHPHIRVTVVLAYIPGKKTEDDHYDDTILPDGIESIPPRYAISYRNDWMLKKADYVVTYITHPFGGAAQYAEKAIRQKKPVINLVDTQ